jgi:hypothetical protein
VALRFRFPAQDAQRGLCLDYPEDSAVDIQPTVSKQQLKTNGFNDFPGCTIRQE